MKVTCSTNDCRGCASRDQCIRSTKKYARREDEQTPKDAAAYANLCYCGSMLDISDDGTWIVSSDSMQIRVAGAGGGDAREVISLSSNENNGVRISGDGRTVVFRVYRDTVTVDGAIPVQRGLYVADVESGEWRQIVGPDAIASLLDVPVEQVSFFGGSSGVDASTDGSRSIFTMLNAPESGGLGQSLFSVNADGSELTDLFGRVSFVLNGAISGDGETIAYIIHDVATNISEAGVVAFSGGDHRKLTDSSRTPPGIGMSLPTGERIQLSADGSRLLLGSTGLLYDTADGTVVQLGVRGGVFSNDPAPLVRNDLNHATMTVDARRFLYLVADKVNAIQLPILDLDPVEFGGLAIES